MKVHAEDSRIRLGEVMQQCSILCFSAFNYYLGAKDDSDHWSHGCRERIATERGSRQEAAEVGRALGWKKSQKLGWLCPHCYQYRDLIAWEVMPNKD